MSELIFLPTWAYRYRNIMILRPKFFAFLISCAFTGTFCFSQQRLVYKQVDSTTLSMEVHEPVKMEADKKYPAMIFFFGGGWVGGSLEHFAHHARYFSQRGMVCVLVDYRVGNRQGTTPFESLKDAKSAMRFVRAHAGEFQIDTTKIVAAGGSAGGHLAAATALVEGFDEASDNLAVSSRPNALVLYNPVIDNGPGGYGFERVGAAYKDFSPLHNITEGAPPTIFFLGTEDQLIPVETARYYKTVMEKVGSRCELHLYEGEGHGFFNYREFDNYRETVATTDQFLQSLGYLKATPVVPIDR